MIPELTVSNTKVQAWVQYYYLKVKKKIQDKYIVHVHFLSRHSRTCEWTALRLLYTVHARPP